MSVFYRYGKSFYRAVVPQSLAVRLNLWSGRSAFSRGLIRLKGRLEETAKHDALYDMEYYRRQDIAMAESAAGIARSLERHWSPAKVIDVGCGSGAVMAAMRELGIEVFGLELSEAALAVCREKGLEVSSFDLEGEVCFEGTADVALSTEVAEHLPAACADRYVDLLCGIAETVVVTAATVGQGGTDHVNEQPNEYWIEKFERRGHEHAQEQTHELREEWKRTGVDRARAKNVMVFRKRSAA